MILRQLGAAIAPIHEVGAIAAAQLHSSSLQPH
jgi:hypothetical protein